MWLIFIMYSRYSYRSCTGRDPYHRYTNYEHTPASSHPKVPPSRLAPRKPVQRAPNPKSSPLPSSFLFTDSCLNFTYMCSLTFPTTGSMTYAEFQVEFVVINTQYHSFLMWSEISFKLFPWHFSLPLKYIFFHSNTIPGKFPKTVSSKWEWLSLIAFGCCSSWKNIKG